MIELPVCSVVPKRGNMVLVGVVKGGNKSNGKRSSMPESMRGSRGKQPHPGIKREDDVCLPSTRSLSLNQILTVIKCLTLDINPHNINRPPPSV